MSKNIVNRQAYLNKSFEDGNGKNIFQKTEKTISDVIESLNETDMEIEKTHDIRCLTNLEMICKKIILEGIIFEYSKENTKYPYRIVSDLKLLI
ncbi:MAG: hypothetical protein ACMZI0_18330 [Symbiopectobacterium sp.]|uniref:hypothetical protein n=1 Tax=Symbiopectobacterium sp. TaxID=2952789 RepID=UPI0039EBD2FD